MNYFKYISIIVIIVVIIIIVMYTNKGEQMKTNNLEYQKISQEQAKQMMDNEDVIVVDVRENYEYEDGHIENSILLPLGQVESSAETVLPNKDAKILVYCRSGNRSRQASMILASLGYTNIYEFGGIMTWEYGITK